MITVDYDDNDLKSALKKVTDHLTDTSELMRALGEILIEDTKQNFINSEGPGGVKWAPKSQATRDAYRRREGTVFPLPLFGPTRDLSSDWHALLGNNSVEVGSNVLYASVLQFGAAKGEFGTDANGNSIPWGDIPARPFLGMDEELEDKLAAEVREYLARIVT